MRKPTRSLSLKEQIRIRRIRMFLALQDPDPDPLVRGANPDPATAPSLFWNNAWKTQF